MNMRWKASARAHERREALRSEELLSARMCRALRSCDGRRTHCSMSVPNGISKIPKNAVVHVAMV
eukprot:5822385-Pleurochrysis_carterae.AAC.1